MKCKDLKAYLDNLVEGEPAPPGLREKLMADAMTASRLRRARQASPTPERPRAQGVFTMRRVFVGIGLIAVVMGVLLWLIPGRNGSYALADVARAMANVKSVHVVGWKLDRSGEKKRIEIWAKGGDKFRCEYEGNETVVDDGAKLVSLSTYEGCTSATINRPKTFPGLEHGMSYLDLFMGRQVLKQLMENGHLGFAGSRPTTLPDGRAAVIMELRSGPEKALVTVDKESNLIRQVEAYDDAGTLRLKLDRCEYDLVLPDSIFRVSIPRNAIVVDQRVPVSESRKKWREEMQKRLEESREASNICKIPSGGCGSVYHSELRFECLSGDGIAVFYIPKRNAYYVLGKALMRDRKTGANRVVENREVRAPRPSDYVRPPRPPAPTPEELKADAMLEKLKVPGAKAVFKSTGRMGGSCGSYHSGLRFHTIGNEPILIQYLPDKNTYRISGKAEVYYPTGRTEVVENKDIDAPGPPDRE